MLHYYFKLSFRQLKKAPGYTLINLLGLSLGLSACYIILIYISFQTSYDRYNENLDQLYLVTAENTRFGLTEPSTPLVLGPTIRDEIPAIEEFARYSKLPGTLTRDGQSLGRAVCAFSDPSIFDILTMPLVRGDVSALRTERNFLVINEALSKKYFPGRDPLGETLTLDCLGESYALKIMAVMKDLPRTSTFTAEAIGPLYVGENFTKRNWGKVATDPLESWDVQSVLTYVRLPEGADRADMERQLRKLSDRHATPARTTIYHLFPLADVYFKSASFVNNRFPAGNIANVYIYSAAAVLLLFLACVNYLLLNLGRASLRTKEVGIRKVFGAGTSNLAGQMIVEATVLALISLPFALAIVDLSLQNASALLGVRIAEGYFHSWGFALSFLLIAIVVGTVAGGYVSFYLSRLNPVVTLGNRMLGGSGKAVLRRLLMTTQMVIFIGFTFASVIIYNQMRYFQETDPGFSPAELIFLYPGGRDFGGSFASFKNELIKIPGVISVSGGLYLPGTESRAVSKYPRPDDPTQLVTVESIEVDRDFVETMGITLIEGVSLANRSSTGPARVCLLNETAKNALGLNDPIGAEVGGNAVIGVVRDFAMHSFRESIPPLIIREGTKYISELAIRIVPGKTDAVREVIKDLSPKFNDGAPMETGFFDERLQMLYEQERKFATIIAIATGIAILVASLGIFGMSIFVCRTRVKEIGIRKVLGASIGEVYLLVTKEFLLLILLSSIVAVPIAYYFTNRWLQQFVYRADIGAWDLLLVVVGDLIIVLLTVSVQALRAATLNPVQSIRYE